MNRERILDMLEERWVDYEPGASDVASWVQDIVAEALYEVARELNQSRYIVSEMDGTKHSHLLQAIVVDVIRRFAQEAARRPVKEDE
jgi:hypothetical protein